MMLWIPYPEKARAHIVVTRRSGQTRIMYEGIPLSADVPVSDCYFGNQESRGMGPPAADQENKRKTAGAIDVRTVWYDVQAISRYTPCT